MRDSDHRLRSDPESARPVKCACVRVRRSKVYAADLESALHYLLRVELAAHDTLEGEELQVFKDFVTLVAKVTTALRPFSPKLPTMLLRLTCLHRCSCIQVEVLW